MHEKYAKDGLVVIEVDIDPAVDARAKLPQVVEKVRNKVVQHGLGSLVNLILDEPPEMIAQKLRFSATPCVYVFGRDGRWRQFENEAATDHKAIEELVAKLLKAGPR